MTNKRAGIIFLVSLSIQLVIGFLLGFSVGRCSSSHSVAGVPQDSPDQTGTIAATVDVFPADADEDAEEDIYAEQEDTLYFVYYRKNMPKFQGKFNDFPDKHMAAVQAHGLKNIPGSKDDLKRLKLVEIKTCDLYAVDKLTHSSPYLTRGAANELEAIARRFQQILKDNNLPKYKIVVTSVLRTGEDVKKLSRSGNVNASQNSAHCYGLTFDISYVSYEKADNDRRCMDSYELKKVLVETMLAEKEAGHVYVKYERKQPCFHTTSRL